MLLPSRRPLCRKLRFSFYSLLLPLAISLRIAWDIPAGTVAEWQRGANAPQFDTLLLISRLLGTTPRSFLLEKPTAPDFAPVKRGSDIHPIVLREKRTALSSDELRQALEAVLTSDEDPPPSLEEVTKRLGYRSSTVLRNRFPELCSAIVSRHTVPIDIKGLRVALERELLSNEEPRSMREVARDLGHPVQTLLRYHPDLCHEIAARRKAYRKRNKEARRQKIREEVRRVVLAMHAEKKYPSQRRVMEHVDRSCVSPPLFELEAYIPWCEVLIELAYQV